MQNRGSHSARLKVRRFQTKLRLEPLEVRHLLSGAALVSSLAATNDATGEYAIEVAPGDLSSANYSFFFTNGTLTVTQAVLTVKADDQGRTYGAPNPILTASYSGFVNGQDASILSGSPALNTVGSATPVGSYPITVAQGDLSVSDTNYTLALVNGTLTVNRATVTGRCRSGDRRHPGRSHRRSGRHPRSIGPGRGAARAGASAPP